LPNKQYSEVLEVAADGTEFAPEFVWVVAEELLLWLGAVVVLVSDALILALFCWMVPWVFTYAGTNMTVNNTKNPPTAAISKFRFVQLKKPDLPTAAPFSSSKAFLDSSRMLLSRIFGFTPVS
jgi:hypothetical protein